MSIPPNLGPNLHPRLVFARPDLADIALEGRVEAARFAEPVERRVIAPLADLRRAPRLDSGIDTQALMGETVRVLEEDMEGFAFVQLARDFYVGYLSSAALGPPAPAPTHRVSAMRTFLYPGPSLKLPIAGFLSFGARVAISGWSGDYAEVPGAGFVHGAHLAEAQTVEPDFVALAQRFLETPYLWGGKSSLGIDCSGLVQIALEGAGHVAPRDSDMQAAGLGEAIAIAEGLASPRRGDLVFWGGHVGLLLDEATLLHANGHHMRVAAEPLAEAIARIEAKSFGAVTGWRRIGG